MKKFVCIIFAGIVLILIWCNIGGVKSQVLSHGPTHRYSFSASPTNDANGLPLVDSIGGADGIVRGAGTKFTGSRLVLSGGNPDISGYGELPAGLLSKNSRNNGGTGELSIEAWFKSTGNQEWSRVFDFGSTGAPGQRGRKVVGPGGTDQGLDYLMYSSQVNDDVNERRLELRDEDPPGGGVRLMDTLVPDSFNTDRHVVVTWKESTGEIKAFENGNLVALIRADCSMSDINDVNVWLGRSQWRDRNLEGEFDEFRIYDHVLTAGEIKFNESNGPDKLIAPH